MWPETAGVFGMQTCMSNRRQGPGRGKKRENLIGSVRLALDAELVCYRNCEWTEKREPRLKQRNFDMMPFLASACVKENRTLLFGWRSMRSLSVTETVNGLRSGSLASNSETST